MKKIAALLKPDVRGINKHGCGGTERVFLNDTNNLKMKNYEIKSYARFEDKENEINAIRLSKICEKIGNYKHKFWNLVFELIYTYKFANTNKDSYLIGYSTLLLPLFSKNAAVMIHNYHHQFWAVNFFRNRYKQANYLFCSNYVMDDYKKKFDFLSDSNSFLLYNAVDKNLFKQNKKTGKNKDKITFLYASAWHKYKGIELLIDTFSSIPEKYKEKYELIITSNENLWLLGNSIEENKYKSDLKKKLAKIPTVKFLGGVEYKKMAKIYNSVDWTLMPSIWQEPFGLIAMESAACKTPVICFNSGGLVEIINDRNGIITSEKNFRELIIDIIKYKKRMSVDSEVNELMLSENRTKDLISIIEKSSA